MGSFDSRSNENAQSHALVLAAGHSKLTYVANLFEFLAFEQHLNELQSEHVLTLPVSHIVADNEVRMIRVQFKFFPISVTLIFEKHSALQEETDQVQWFMVFQLCQQEFVPFS